MADGRSVTTISEADYDAIEAAVMETERGRWFLREYARRNRNADTEVLLGAINRLEQAVAGDRVAQDVDRLRNHLREMATAINRTKAEIATIHAVEQEHRHLLSASEALDAITRQTEQATSDILAAAEHIQESAWTLREDGADPQLCDDLDRRATEIYTACSFQDLTAQRIVKIVQTLRYLEGRINTMIAIWDQTEGALMPPPPGPEIRDTLDEVGDLDLSQSDIDDVIIDKDLFEMSAAPRGDAHLTTVYPDDLDFEPGESITAEADEAEALPAAPPLPDVREELDFVDHPAPAPATKMRTEAFADIDALPTREKLRLFS